MNFRHIEDIAITIDGVAGAYAIAIPMDEQGRACESARDEGIVLVVIVVESDKDVDVLRNEIDDFLIQQLPPALLPRWIVAYDSFATLPLSDTRSKVSRVGLKQMLLTELILLKPSKAVQQTN